jgi:glycine/D-amino acid oxidase-like deaminating enzyme
MSKILIVGAGIIGASIAYELSSIPDLEITLIDEKIPASGSTGAALGVLMGAISHKTKGRGWKLRRDSLARYETLIPELRSLTGIEIPFNTRGIVMLRFSEEEEGGWEKLARIRYEQGLDLELWDRETLREYCPEVRDDRCVGAIYSPSDRQVNPTILTRALVDGAAINGVKCHFGVKVENFEIRVSHDENLRRCDRVHTSIGAFAVDRLILCTGIGSFALTRELAAPLDIRPVIGQAIQMRLPRPLGRPDFQPVLTGDDVHIVPLGNDEYWIGATVEFTEKEEAELLEEVRRQAIAFCPDLADGEILRSWSGKRPRPEGRPAPIIEALAGYNNVILATGHYRNGVLLAPATAVIVREMIAGG